MDLNSTDVTNVIRERLNFALYEKLDRDGTRIGKQIEELSEKIGCTKSRITNFRTSSGRITEEMVAGFSGYFEKPDDYWTTPVPAVPPPAPAPAQPHPLERAVSVLATEVEQVLSMTAREGVQAMLANSTLTPELKKFNASLSRIGDQPSRSRIILALLLLRPKDEAWGSVRELYEKATNPPVRDEDWRALVASAADLFKN